MISLSRCAELDVAAASGLVVHDDVLWVIADDETFLARYGMDGAPRERIALFDELLPAEHKERKRRKPDLEALTLLPDGRLLAFGSGSTATRRRGALVEPSSKRVQVVDLSALYTRLEQDFPELNIEGAAVVGTGLWLAQRGNGAAAQHALIELDLGAVLASLARDARIDATGLRALRPIALGAIDGVGLGITDLAPHPDAGFWFCAAAEASLSTYLDGACVGAALGHLACDGQVLSCERVDVTCKLEGIAAGEVTSREAVLWLVADGDDRGTRAPLFSARLPR